MAVSLLLRWHPNLFGYNAKENMVRLEPSVTDISAWMKVNMFMFNQKKTELIIFRPKRQVEITEEIRL